MKILLTGFEPFGSKTDNVSKKIVESFANDENVDTLILPVSYRRASEIICEVLAAKDYNVLIMTGETRSSLEYVRLERVGLNLMDGTIADNDGILMDEVKINSNVPDAIITDFPVKKIFNYLKSKGFRVKVSNSAGTYVCNSLYFNSLDFIKSKSLATEAVFLHFPAKEKFLSLDEMIQTLKEFIKFISA